MEGFKLNSGAVMPVIGMGIGRKEDRTVDAIFAAIEIGYRCFDTARQYTTEPLLGEALARAFKAGLVRREDVFVTTKLHPADTDDVVTALRSSLSDLRLDYVDLFLVHWPLKAKRGSSIMNIKPGDIMAIDQKELWQAMESCVDAGLTKSIGVSNWSIKKLEELLALARIPPAVNQVELHPIWRQEKLLEYCKQKGIVITAYSPLGAPNSVYGINDVITNSTINEIAQRIHKTPAQVILRWLYEKGVSFVVRSYNSKRLEENFKALDYTLSAADFQLVDSISEQKKAILGQWFVQPECGPFKSLKDLWDE
jgi:diketogulonate reductase-like aldo/keto reductase